MNKLTRLTIKKFRNVAPTTLEFRPGLNVVLGRNAAGKTTLLRLLSTLVGVSDEALQDDPIEASQHISGEFLEIEHTILRERVNESPFHLGPGRATRDDLPTLQETDSFTFQKDGMTVIKAEALPNEIVLNLKGKQSREARLYPEPPLSAISTILWEIAESTRSSEEWALEVISSQIETAGRMDESLERFNRLLKLEVQTDGKHNFRWNDREVPHSISSEVFSKPLPEGTTTTFYPEFLHRSARVIGYNSASARFDIERLSSEPRRQNFRLSNLKFFFKRMGEEISHDRLSYGQKRLLAFFAHADASRDLIIADELVNGLHHEWISACLDEIGERQAFLTSQNPLLLDFLRFDSVEQVRHTFILCERASNDAGAQLIWRNPTEDEAESFFLAYQTGIQRVSDILLTKGLW